MNFFKENKNKIYIGLMCVVVAFLILVAVIYLLDQRDSDKQRNVISFSGSGEVMATPDVASVNFTIRREAKTVKDAQQSVSLVEQKVLEFLKNSSILDKDIKTVSASFNPKYKYRTQKIDCNQYGCPSGKSVIVGYEAYESISVKIRNTDDVGKIVEGLGSLGVTELNGPNFTVDNEDTLKAEARKKAIDEAKQKAVNLAKDLGVRLGKIVSFSEDSNYPVPVYTKSMMMDSLGAASSVTPTLPKGENTITSNVTITYEIR